MYSPAKERKETNVLLALRTYGPHKSTRGILKKNTWPVTLKQTILENNRSRAKNKKMNTALTVEAKAYHIPRKYEHSSSVEKDPIKFFSTLHSRQTLILA